MRKTADETEASARQTGSSKAKHHRAHARRSPGCSRARCARRASSVSWGVLQLSRPTSLIQRPTPSRVFVLCRATPFTTLGATASTYCTSALPLPEQKVVADVRRTEKRGTETRPAADHSPVCCAAPPTRVDVALRPARRLAGTGHRAGNLRLDSQRRRQHQAGDVHLVHRAGARLRRIAVVGVPLRVHLESSAVGRGPLDPVRRWLRMVLPAQGVQRRHGAALRAAVDPFRRTALG